MKQTKTTLKELTARYRAVLLKCAVAGLTVCSASAEATQISDGTNTYIGSFGVPLTVYDNDATVGTFYGFSWSAITNAEISGATTTLDNASRVGTGLLSLTQSTNTYAEISALTAAQITTATNNLITVLTAMNNGNKNYAALPAGVKAALAVMSFSGGQTIAEYLQATWPGASANMTDVRNALLNDYENFNSFVNTPEGWDATVSIADSTLTLNGTSAVVNAAQVYPGSIAINNSTIIANGTNALATYSGSTTNITMTGGSRLQVNNGATLTIRSSGNRVSLTNSNLTLNGTITGNVSLNGTAALQGTGTISGNLDAASASVLNMQNGAIDAITASTVTGGNFSVALDVNATAGTIDHFTAGTFTTGTITVSGLNFLSAEKSFALTVLDGNASAATLVLSGAVSAAYNVDDSYDEWRNNLSTSATWETEFTKTKYTVETTKTLTVQNNKTLIFAINNSGETEGETLSLGDTLELLNTMDAATRMMTNDTSADSYTVTDDLGATAAGTFTVNGAKAGGGAATIDMDSHTGFSVGDGATLKLQNIVFAGNTGDAGSVLTVAGGAAELSNDTIGNAVSVTSGTLTLIGGNSLGGLNNAGTVTLTGENRVGAMSGAGTLTNNGSLTLNGATNAQIIGGTGRTYIDAALTTTAAINQAITINGGRMLTASAEKIGGAVTNGGVLALTGGTLDRTVSGGAVHINGNVTSNVSLSNVTISAGNVLTIGAGNVGTGLTNNGTLALSGGTLTKTVSGTVHIDGDVTSNVALSNATVNATKSLTIGAGNVGTGLTNNGTLVLTAGTLGNALAGTGTVRIGGNVVSSVALNNVTIESGRRLTIGAGNIGATLTNNGLLALSDGTLNTAVSGMIQIAGDVTSNVTMAHTTVNSGRRLTIGAGNVGANFINNGTLVLTAGTLSNALTGSGVFQINGDVVSEVALRNVTINAGKKLTISADSVDNTFTNNGILALSGGTLTSLATGTVHIDGDVTSQVLVTDTVINAGHTLTIGANNVGTGVTNSGTLVLTDGTLHRAVSGAGAFQIDGDVVSAVDLANVTINAGKKLTINADYADGTFTNNGVLALSGGTLGTAVAGTGAVQIAGDVTSGVALSNVTINSGKKLTIGAGNIGANLTNNGVLALSGGTLDTAVSGTVLIDGNVTSNVTLSNATVNSGRTLTISADDIGANLTNNGTLALSGGTLGAPVSGTGAYRIDGNVTSGIALSNVTITAGNKLTIGAGNIGANLTNNGTLALSGGTLNTAVFGTIEIDGDVVSNVDLANVTINADKKLTIDAGYADGTFTNNGILALSGGTLTSAIAGTGTVQIAGDVTSTVALANVTINSGKKLTIGAGNIGAGLTNNGVLSLTDGTLATAVSGTVRIDGDVTSSVALSNATVNSGRTLTIAAGNIGENLINNGTLALSGGTLTSAVSGTGVYRIAGDVTSEVDLANVTITAGNRLAINAGYVDNTFTNNGTLALSGGTLGTAVSGTIEIDGAVTSSVALSNATVNASKSLTISAGNVGTGVANNGTLVLTGGTLGNAVSGAGAVQIDGDVVSDVDMANVTINAGKKLTINATYIGDGEFTNNGTLALSGGTLMEDVAGTGAIRIDGEVFSVVALGNTTIGQGGALAIFADDVGANVTNNGRLLLFEGTLSNALAGGGETEIYGDVVSGVGLSKTTVTEYASLTIGAENVGENLTNDGTVVLTGGNLTNALAGTGSIRIDGNVSSSVALSNTTINATKQLTIAAAKVGANMTNDGTLVLTSGRLSNAVSGDGAVQIDGIVVSDVDLENVTINENKKLTINADYADGTFTNNGALALSGGTLDTAVLGTGTVQIAGNVTSNVALANTTILAGNTLTIGAGNVGANMTNNGTLALSGGTLGNDVSETVRIVGDVTSNVALANTTVTAGNTLTIGAGNVGANMTNNGILALSDGTLTRTVSGTVRIVGNVTSDVALANTTVTSGNTLTIGAGNIGAGLTNDGTLALSGGTLTRAVAGTGSVRIDGDVTSNILLANTTVSAAKTLTIGAGNVGANMTNSGTLVLKDGTLANEVSGAGAVQIDGNVVSDVALANVTINQGKKLTISADYIEDGLFTNNGVLALSGGILMTDVAGMGTVRIDGDVVSLVGLGNITISSSGELILFADDVGGAIINNGKLMLFDGTLDNAVAGAGETEIIGDVVSNVALSNAKVDEAASLTIAADNIRTETRNEGDLILTGGTLSKALTGAGAVRISGDVVSETGLSNVTVDAGRTLTLDSGHVGAGFTNNGTVVLTGGEISNPLSGNVTMTGYTEMKTGADFTGAHIDLTGGELSIGTNALVADAVTGGRITLDLKEYAAAETIVTTTPAGTVKLEIWPFDVTNKAVQHYTLTSTDNGYSIDFILPEFFAVSKTPFAKEDAMTIGEFDEASWTGGDLYVVALNVAEIAASEMVKNGYALTTEDRNAVQKLSDDMEDRLTGQYQANYEAINDALIMGFIEEDYGRIKTILAEAGTDTTPAAAQTAVSNAQTVMSVVSSRLGGAPSSPAAHGRSGGDFVAGNSAVWAQGLVNKAKLSGTNGFDSDSTGFAAGYEYNIDDSYKVGAGYAFASTDIKTERSKTGIDTHTFFVYGEYKPDALYINGTLSYGRSKYDERTRMLGLKSDYKADTLALQAKAGYALEFFTPEAGLRYMNVAEKAYTDFLGARVSGRTTQTWTVVAGANAAKDFVFDKGTVSGRVSAAMTYDLTQGGANRTVSLVNGTGYIVRGENLPRFGFEFGAGASYKLNDKTEIGLSYDGKFKKRYSDHTGILNVRYAF